MKVAVLVPVLGRPHRAKPLVDSLAASQMEHELVPIFLCSASDTAEQKAARAAGAEVIVMPFDPGPGDYAKKLNIGYRTACSRGYEWSFLGADDVTFRPGWFEAGLRTHQFHNLACVVGTNDLGNPRVIAGRHSTHTLVHAGYAECGTVDEDDRILHEGYDHNYVDEEFIQTAAWRGTFAFARDSYVEHLHPDWHKGEWDETYARGKARFEDDRRYYESRKRLWGR